MMSQNAWQQITQPNPVFPQCYIYFAAAEIITAAATEFYEMSWSRNYMTLWSCPLHWTQMNGCLLSLHFEDEQLEQ